MHSSSNLPATSDLFLSLIPIPTYPSTLPSMPTRTALPLTACPMASISCYFHINFLCFSIAPFQTSLLTPLLRSASLPPLPFGSLGGRLALFAYNWSKITTNRWVLDIIHWRYLIEFFSFPPHHPPPFGGLGNPSQQDLQEEAHTLLHKGAIEHVPHQYKAVASTPPTSSYQKKGMASASFWTYRL